MSALTDWRFWAMMAMLWGSFGYVVWHFRLWRR